MAGWDYPFTIDNRDVDLLRECLRILRRTCGRYYVDFSYYMERQRSTKTDFMLVFSCRPEDLCLSMSEFAIEMRAVSTLQRNRRRKNLPLRLLREMVYTATDEPILQSLDPAKVPAHKVDDVIRLIEDYELALSTYFRAEMSAAEFIETCHSVVVNLSLLLIPSTKTSDKFPQLIEKCSLPESITSLLRELGKARNK